ncbi:shikimate kinase [Gaetbulibacter aestuarii]|uniref:Shikimate kinase n=1 Tax=Gaetbulibacter aestuarii TaxID=1502358 RepID=A0ABW7MXV5_9FLAO
MIVVLIGYMASGKSVIGKVLAENLNYGFIDLDDFIEEKEQKTISDIFKLNGEIRFRKLESHYLQALLSTEDNLVLSLGGGTPCYGDNMKMLLDSDQVKTVYLRASVNTLVNRLKNEKSKRPLIAHIVSEDDLIEFVAKHLFERRQFYEQAEVGITTDNKSVGAISNEISEFLNQ